MLHSPSPSSRPRPRPRGRPSRSSPRAIRARSADRKLEPCSALGWTSVRTPKAPEPWWERHREAGHPRRLLLARCAQFSTLSLSCQWIENIAAVIFVPSTTSRSASRVEAVSSCQDTPDHGQLVVTAKPAEHPEVVDVQDYGCPTVAPRGLRRADVGRPVWRRRGWSCGRNGPPRFLGQPPGDGLALGFGMPKRTARALVGRRCAGKKARRSRR